MRSVIRLTASISCALLLGTGLVVAAATPAAAATENPILGDGSYYSADPTVLVVDGTLYVHAGRDEAGETQNGFIMNEWQAFSTTDVDGGQWEHHPNQMRPETVFDWATPGRAYAGQVVEGVDGRFYWYVPVNEKDSVSPDAFVIGVAVSDSPLGPWADHAGGPIVSQEILGNTILNIDPTVFVDDDQRVYLYWGSFGQLRSTELAADMKSLVGEVQSVGGLTGYFEAPWLFERDGTYYLAYAGNNAGPSSDCTPANYHACIAYGTADSPLGPWTYRGTVLKPVSSTTSHPAITEFKGQWYIVYHTADAVGGNHFRRSVAIDALEWDDTQTPARIKTVTQTPEKSADLTPRANIAPWASVTVSNTPVPTQYWVKSLNDEIIRPNPLPPDMWGSWTGTRPAEQWLQYTWDQPVRVDSTEIKFWRDAPPGIGNGVSDPASWKLQYWSAGAWLDVPNPSEYGTSTTSVQQVNFDAVTTTQLRATLAASPGDANPAEYSALAVEEWKVNAAAATDVREATATTLVGELPILPDLVTVDYADGSTLQTPVRWNSIDEADVAAAGTITVSGFVEGYADGTATATVTITEEPAWRTNVALTAQASATYTADWNSTGGLNDGVEPNTSGDVPDENPTVWGAWPQVDDQWIQYDWADPVTIDEASLYFIHNLTAAGDGIAVPQDWSLEYWNTDADGGSGAWAPVGNPTGYGTDVDRYNVVGFDTVTTDRLRANLTAAGTVSGQGSLGVKEWQVRGETIDVTAPEITMTARGTEGGAGWFVSPVTVRVTAADDRDQRMTVGTRVDDGEWASTENVRSREVVVANDGLHTIRGTATDAAGNESAEQSVAVSIDTQVPTAEAVVDAVGRSVTVTGADDGSGLAGLQFSVDTQSAWQEYGEPVVVDEQKHDVFYRSVDVAGNVSAVGKVTVQLSNDAPLVGNIAPLAVPTASFTSGWNSVTALNDDAESGASWGTWPMVGEQWIQYEWDREVPIDRAEIKFFVDQPDEANGGVIPPRSWTLQYLDKATQAWTDVAASVDYAREREVFNSVAFEPVVTTSLRAVMQAWGEAEGEGSSGVFEWRVFAALPTEPPVDTTPPTVSVNAAPAEPDSGWYTGEVTFAALATDDTDDAPLVEQSLDGAEWSAYAGPIVVAGDGEHLLRARATDAAGNVSEVQEARFRIDSEAPVTTASVATLTATSAMAEAPADGLGTPNEPVMVTFTSADALSGVAFTEYSVGEEWEPVPESGVTFAEVGSYTVSYRSVDVAGNIEQVQSIAVEIEPVEIEPVDPTVPPGEPGEPGQPEGAGGQGPDSTPGQGAGGLASTGSEPGPWAVLALLVLFAGAVTLRLRRKAERAR